MHHEQEVQLIAYHIWEEEGHPHGHDLDHWLKAEASWQERHAPAVQHVAVAQKPASAIQVKEARTTQTRPPAR